MYAIIILEVESDTPGIQAAFGPFPSYEDAEHNRRIARDVAKALDVDPELVQVTKLEAL